MPWKVVLTKPIPIIKDDYRAGFFPRTLHYARDAYALRAEVARKGGDARVEKVAK